MTKSSKVDTSELIPGKTRIRDADGFIATILYIGPVASAKNEDEIYVGVEWDDETRGKHDGSVISLRTNQLVRHFSLTKPSQTAGSFLRLNKIDTGVPLDVKLIKGRYVEHDAPLVAPNNILPYSARTSSGRDKPIEFLGELNVRKRQQIEDLDDITLRSMGISKVSAENANELRNTFTHLKELDLAGNLISEWDTVFEILRLFPSLQTVSFASNRLLDIPSSMIINSGEFSNMTILNLNRCSISSFQTVLILNQLCPNLQELCIASADLSDANMKIKEWMAMADDETCPSISGFTQLKLLDCSNCNLTSWNDQIRIFRHLPNLETLLLDDNPLTSVSLYEQEKDNEFSNLSDLQISGTAINSWNAMEDIAFFPKLRSLRFKNCPLTSSMGTGDARANTIARLPQIVNLNYSAISEKERLEAERRYVSNVSRELLLLTTTSRNVMNTENNSSSDDVDDVTDIKRRELFSKYSRFEELMIKHKDVMLMAQSASLSGGTISHAAVNVTIRSMAVDSCTAEPLQKRLPGNLKVGRLKMMCARAFGLDVELQSLYFRGEGEDLPTEMDDDDNTLAYYGVNDGCEILMNEIDLEAKKRQEEREIKLRNKLIDEQEKSSNSRREAQKNEMKAQVAAVEMAAERLAS